ncbi:MAG: CNNM domain-containing protein [Planctomycetota bacterium]
MINSILFTFLIVLFIILTGLFSGSETGMYRLSRLRLRLGIEKKKLSFIMLGRCIKDSNGLLLSMLIGKRRRHCLFFQN